MGRLSSTLHSQDPQLGDASTVDPTVSALATQAHLTCLFILSPIHELTLLTGALLSKLLLNVRWLVLGSLTALGDNYASLVQAQ